MFLKIITNVNFTRNFFNIHITWVWGRSFVAEESTEQLQIKQGYKQPVTSSVPTYYFPPSTL